MRWRADSTPLSARLEWMEETTPVRPHDPAEAFLGSNGDPSVADFLDDLEILFAGDPGDLPDSGLPFSSDPGFSFPPSGVGGRGERGAGGRGAGDRAAEGLAGEGSGEAAGEASGEPAGSAGGGRWEGGGVCWGVAGLATAGALSVKNWVSPSSDEENSEEDEDEDEDEERVSAAGLAEAITNVGALLRGGPSRGVMGSVKNAASSSESSSESSTSSTSSSSSSSSSSSTGLRWLDMLA